MFLFNHKFRIVGYLICLPAILIFVAKYILKMSLEFLRVPVFAIQSIFVETKYFFWMETDISDELFTISLITSLTLIALSKEKNEIEDYNRFRLKAFSLAIIINSCFLIFGMAFFYGISAIYVLVINIFSFLFIYIIVFKILVFKANQNNMNSANDGLDN